MPSDHDHDGARPADAQKGTRQLGAFIGWTITDHDAPREASVVTAVVDGAEWVEFHTLAGWSFGGKRTYLEILDLGHSVEVSIAPFLRATLEPPGASA